MSKSVVVECPKGVYTRLMPGSQALELYHERNKGNKEMKAYQEHMVELDRKFKKEQGLAN